MIVEQQESAPGGQHIVNASRATPFSAYTLTKTLPDRETKNGYAIRTRRWGYPSTCSNVCRILLNH